MAAKSGLHCFILIILFILSEGFPTSVLSRRGGPQMAQVSAPCVALFLRPVFGLHPARRFTTMLAFSTLAESRR
jgi:hypothetical protein